MDYLFAACFCRKSTRSSSIASGSSVHTKRLTSSAAVKSARATYKRQLKLEQASAAAAANGGSPGSAAASEADDNVQTDEGTRANENMKENDHGNENKTDQPCESQ